MSFAKWADLWYELGMKKHIADISFEEFGLIGPAAAKSARESYQTRLRYIRTTNEMIVLESVRVDLVKGPMPEWLAPLDDIGQSEQKLVSKSKLRSNR